MNTSPRVPSLPNHLRGIQIEIPRTWTPEQALAVFDMIDALRDAICALYNDQLQDLMRQQCTRHGRDDADDAPDYQPI